MKLTRKQTIEAAKYCTTISNCATCCMVNEHDCRAEIIKHALHYLEENEPASAGTETSPEVSSNDTNNISHLDDTTLREICQEAENIYDRFNQAFDNDLESSMGIRLYGEAMGLLEAQINKLKNIKEDKDE